MPKAIEVVLGGLLVLGGCAADPGAPASTVEPVAEQQSALGHGLDALTRVRCPDAVPATLSPPADATLDDAFGARGVQIYVCTASAVPGGAPAWTLKGPHALLFHGFDVAAIHFAGPSWQALDGSVVTGTKVAADPGPDPTAIPWLLLQAATNVGAGAFSDVTWIQRLATEGGLAPTTGCDADHLTAQVAVPYRADYFLYHAAAAGQRIRRCAAE